MANASAYGRGSIRLGDRQERAVANHPRLLPICGRQEGYFVVPCTGTAHQDHGGELIPAPSNTTGISRRDSIIVSIFWGEVDEQDEVEQGVDPEILRLVQEDLGHEGGICSDRLLYRYGEWLRRMRDHSQQMVDVTAEEKLLREWVSRYWSRPEMGAWVCRHCILMDDDWQDTVGAIRTVYPDLCLVRYFDESAGRERSRARNTVAKDVLGKIPAGLTHRSAWDPSERIKC